MQVWTHAVLLLCVCTPLSVGDEFRFASYYGDHMVLQKAPERALVWGFASTGSGVQLSLLGPLKNQFKFVPVINGIWKVILDPVQAGGTYNLTAVQKGSSEARITLTDVLFGDVWLCSGQSNMALTLAQVFNASQELALASEFPNVRIFQAALQQSSYELYDLEAVAVTWSRPTPELLGGKDFSHFSALCWLFGRYLYEKLKNPIGLVESCWSGTPIEAWSSLRALQRCGLAKSDTNLLWDIPWKNGVLWNAMIHPLLNMTIKGVIWYQGESNTQYNQEKYSCTFPVLIDDWRMAFHTGSEGQTAADFPFGFVQLCGYKKLSPDGFAEIRWHQTADHGFVPNERMNKTFMAVTMDLPDEASPWGSIHPRDKQDVAYRLVLGAMAIAYEETNVSFQGPFPISGLFQQNFLNITFNQRIKAVPSNNTFEICCSEEKEPCDLGAQWFPAPIKKWGIDYVLVSIADCSIDHVAGLRYAWTNWPCEFKACPMYSADRVLPVPPFIFYRWPWP